MGAGVAGSGRRAVGAVAPGFVAELERLHYAPSSAYQQAKVMGKLSAWLLDPDASSWAKAQAPDSRRAADPAPLDAPHRDSEGDGAYRLLRSLTTASQLTSEMLAET